MAVQNPYLSADGDLRQAARKRAGEKSIISGLASQPTVAQPTGPLRLDRPAPGAGGGQGILAGLAQPASMSQPKQTSFDATNTPAAQPKPGILEGLAGGAKMIAGVGSVVPAAIADASRVGAAYALGGDPGTLEGGKTKYLDKAIGTTREGFQQAGGAAEGLRSAGRSALGVEASNPLIAPTQPLPAKEDNTLADNPLTATTQAAQPGGQGYALTGIGAGMAGGEIAGRLGANGVMEFTNEAATPGAVTSARPMPNGGIGGIGDGIGTFSQMQPGDAQLALDRFGRANDIRAQTIQESRRGGIGEGGGRVTVVEDSSRAPSLEDRMRARMNERNAQTEALQAQTQQGILSGLDERATGQLQRQRLQQELTMGNVDLSKQQRLAELGAMMADPGLGADQQQAAREAYTSLSTPAKDRFKSQDVILGRDENGRDIRGTQLIDVTTGRPVAGIGDGMQQRRTVTSAEVDATAKSRGVSRDQVIELLKGAGVTVSS